MATEKDLMVIKNIMNLHIGEEEKMLLNKMKICFENVEVLPKNLKNGFENVEVLPKKLKNGFLVFINHLLNGDGNLEETIMNIHFDENDVNFLKEIHKKIVETKIFPQFFDKIDDDDYNFLLGVKDETLIKRLEEKYQNVLF